MGVRGAGSEYRKALKVFRPHSVVNNRITGYLQTRVPYSIMTYLYPSIYGYLVRFFLEFKGPTEPVLAPIVELGWADSPVPLC